MHAPSVDRTSRQRRRLLRTFVAGVVWIVALAPIGRAQSDITDQELTAASRGRTLAIGAVADGRITTFPLEVYVARVLAGENDPRAADGSQQALAIAIRTYALKNAGRHARDGYDLCDATHCQVPRPSTPASRRAAMATAGQVLVDRGALAEVFYSASCGGRSENAAEVWPGADYPYLVSRGDDVCDGDRAWTTELRLDDVARVLARAGFQGDRLTDVRVASRTSSGRAARLTLVGLRPDVIAADQFRLAVGATVLRSTQFTLERDGDVLRFTGRGFGHGVGMCVIGAGRRALRGESARAILAQYYPGLEVRVLDVVPSAAVPASTQPGRPAVALSSTPGAGRGIQAVVPPDSGVSATEVERLTARAHAELSARLGVSIAPITVRLHPSLDAFRLATNRPWWVSALADGTSVDLAPAAVLVQRGGVAPAISVAVAELLLAEPFARRPLWVRVGGARYFAGVSGSQDANLRCPADAELTIAVSAAAQRDAEARATACFARELARVKDWRAVR